MKIEIISIGDEILKGRIINTNASFLSHLLQKNGYSVSRQTTLPDHKELLSLGLKEALSRSDLVICTGGLGPTLDDLTREAAADVFNSDFYIDQNLAGELKKRYQDRYHAVEDQARIPRKATAFYNPVGSAPGLVFSEGGKTLILLPGVPKEMESLFLEQVIPFLQKKWPVHQTKKMVQLNFCMVYESLLDPLLRRLSSHYPLVEAGIYPGHGFLCVCLLSSDADQISSFQKGLEEHFGNYLFSASSGKIEEALMAWFVKHQKTVAFAESCTGGMLASHVTSLSGASHYFLGSFVVYSNAMKEQILGVSKETLQSHGAESEETVREMLEGVFKRTTADYAIAVSGVAGPSGGSNELPVGTIWAAVGERGKSPDVGKFIARGSRETIILTTTNYLLGALWRKVEKGIPAFPLIL